MADYADVVDRLTALASWYEITQMGLAGEYPVFCVRVGASSFSPDIWINAGTHGDEPAGVEAALRFLESLPAGIPPAPIVVTPCLNPYGYVHEQRENIDGVDLNWSYKRFEIAEIGMIRELIRGTRFRAVIDLHEDWESPGYYLYEQFRAGPPIGVRITERVRAHCPVNDAPMIEGEPAERGVIHPNLEVPKRRSGNGVPVEVFNNAADHQITSESPKEMEMDIRVQAHLAAIEVVLESYGR